MLRLLRQSLIRLRKSSLDMQRDLKNTCRLSLLAVGAIAFAAPRADAIDYLRDIKPLLKARCYTCHGGRKQEAGLRLDTGTFVRRGGDSGDAMVAGKPAESLLIARVKAEEGERMPPEGEPLTTEQIELLEHWIARGAESPDDERAESDPRDHWAFQVPARRVVPPVAATFRTRNPIDHFVARRLNRENLQQSAPADRIVLMRRLYLDLLGLPPGALDVRTFLRDSRPDSYDRLVDRVLASPAFGERWGRHWLDLARYADSNGYEDDRLRPDAWRFRDWVINAINDDLPYDRFTVAQLAGDLLPQATYDDRVAVGFHRMTLSNEGGADSVEEEFRILAVKDRTDTTGQVWMGLSVGCAKCHSHKYDPISQREYYELFAFFNNAEKFSIDAPPLPDRYTDEYNRALAEWNGVVKHARARLERYEREQLPAKLARWESRSDGSAARLRGIRTILKTAVSQRSSTDQTTLANLIAPLDPDYTVAMGSEISNSSNSRPQPPSTHAMSFTAKRRKSHVHKRGNFVDLGDEVQPSTPGFLPPLSARGPRADRLDLARWIVGPRHPLTSRVAVNRIWQHLFGRGLVATSDAFGIAGEPPSHPRLLDWLAHEYLDRNWSRKSLVRRIVSSATYRQSSRARPELAETDPDNLLLARQARIRVEAECVRDLALAAAGMLNRQLGGPSFQPALPSGLTDQDELRSERLMMPSGAAERYRRGVYINVQRMLMLPMLQSFDVADANSTCARREQSNTPVQALTMLNDPVFFEAAQALGRRIASESIGNPADRVRFAFRICLAREPEPFEIDTIHQLAASHERWFASQPERLAEVLGDARIPDGIEPGRLAAWISVARTMINLDEFITRE